MEPVFHPKRKTASSVKQRADNTHAVASGQDADRILELVGKALQLWSVRADSGVNFENDHQLDASLLESDGVGNSIQDLLRQHGALRPDSIASQLGIPLPTVQRRLRQLLRQGFVTKTGKTKGVRYSLSTTQK